VTKLARFRFSLAALLLLVMWSAVVLWLNTTPGEVRENNPNVAFGPGYRWLHYGWPLTYAWDVCRLYAPPNGVHFAWYSWALVVDTVVGILLVAVLTWGSGDLWRRVKHIYRCVKSPPANANSA
jgi:hypothetical protein